MAVVQACYADTVVLFLTRHARRQNIMYLSSHSLNCSVTVFVQILFYFRDHHAGSYVLAEMLIKSYYFVLVLK